MVQGDSVLYSHVGGEVVFLPKDAALPLTLKSREFEVFTVVPVKELSNGVRFAPVGLVKMFNSGGAIKELQYDSGTAATVEMKVHGCGLFGAYSSAQPKRISVDSKEVEFGFEEGTGLVSLDLRVPEEELYLWNITVEL
ncbi:GALACTINOL--SUCROSE GALACTOSYLTRANSFERASE 1-RELATED [Salix koriyanagi]|uniref:GALACTINOL--SUCROSE GALACTOSYLTRANSFERASE 1-RELATED n=1 Tax=Salix koriyanagi TaxID=2511006 RepID=A0A9Q0UCZ1_9ROSI|nr:GALACTINOL--SUCROSE GALACTOSYLTRANSFERASE 1-RELATED [Salix koriyanagi]